MVSNARGSSSIIKEVFVDTTLIIVIAVVVLVIVGLLSASSFSSRNRAKRLQDRFGPEYDRTVQTLGNEKKAQTEPDERQKHIASLNINPLSAAGRERYLVNWADIQSKFVDEPSQAIGNAGRLIMEVMQIRAYPVSDFEQRVADISVNYPALVINYRAAHEIALKNEKQQANTEEIR